MLERSGARPACNRAQLKWSGARSEWIGLAMLFPRAREKQGEGYCYRGERSVATRQAGSGQGNGCEAPRFPSILFGLESTIMVLDTYHTDTYLCLCFVTLVKGMCHKRQRSLLA
eukprot:5007024-Pleurochrysis_carterae.AAC.2